MGTPPPGLLGSPAHILAYIWVSHRPTIRTGFSATIYHNQPFVPCSANSGTNCDILFNLLSWQERMEIPPEIYVVNTEM